MAKGGQGSACVGLNHYGRTGFVPRALVLRLL